MLDQSGTTRKFLTPAAEFRDVSRGNPRPHSLQGEALAQARLTPKTWRLELVAEGGAKLEKPRRLADNTAIDLPTLEALGQQHSVRFLKAMQCLNIAQPLGQGLWEGVPLREVLKLAGKLDNARRAYWWGFHNNDLKQRFQSSLGLNQIYDTPPGELPVFVAYRLNGEPISLTRGGPVRLIVPWAHGFKSIKWLQVITVTNEYQVNDTYALNNNDPDSYLKTMARIDDGPEAFQAGQPLTLTGTAMVGLPGLQRVEYWLRPDTGTHGKLADDDPAWRAAQWKPCQIEPLPADWGALDPRTVWGFDPATGKPREWPMRWSIALWSVTLPALNAGAWEFRVRTVDRNGFAQPEPRPYQKSGQNFVQCKIFLVKET